ncbi:MAG: MaoC family dehydratase [Candidatus Binatia bacterium]
MTARSDFAHIDVGDELSTLRLTLTPEQVKQYAVTAGMPGGRFMDDEEARKEGLPGQIAPGNMSLALLSRLIAASFPGMRLKRLNATFRVPVRPNVPIIVHGVVTEKHASEQGCFVECDLVLESDEGERWVTGTASVYLPQHN